MTCITSMPNTQDVLIKTKIVIYSQAHNCHKSRFFPSPPPVNLTPATRTLNNPASSCASLKKQPTHRRQTRSYNGHTRHGRSRSHGPVDHTYLCGYRGLQGHETWSGSDR